MKSFSYHAGVRSVLAITAFATIISLSSAAEKKRPFKVSGLFIDGCSCDAPCPCEIVGLAHGCEGVGALVLKSSTFGGQDISGAKIAYGAVPGKWVRLYIDAKNPGVRKAAEEFARTAFAAFGKIESVKDAEIQVSGEGGRYTLLVDGGKVMKLETEPVLGGDKKTPIAINNTQNPISPTFLQAKTVSGKYADGGESFALKGSNAYFNDKVNSSGEL